MLLVAQTLNILYQHRLKEKYLLGIWAAVTALLILVFMSIVALKLVHEEVFIADKNTQVLFVVTQLGACLLTIITFLNVQRRPMIYFDNKPVDKEYTSSVLGRYTLSWASPILQQAGNSNCFTLDDLPKLSNYMRSRFLLASFQASNSERRQLGKAVFRLFFWAFLHQVFLTVLTNITQFGPQYAMYRLLLHLEQQFQGSPLTLNALIWVIGLALCMIFNSIAESWLSWVGWSQIAIPLRALISTLIFAKSLRRKDVNMIQSDVSAVLEASENKSAIIDVSESPEGGAPLPEEKIITGIGARPEATQATSNLIAVDTQRISGFSSVCWFFPASVVRLCLSVYFLYFLIGWRSLLAGVVAWLTTMPINAFVSKRYGSLQGKLMKARDRRTAIIAEVLQNIRQIKLAAQETQWRAKISDRREPELNLQWRAFMYQAGLFCLLIAGPVLLSSFSLLTYAYLNGSLRPSIAFTALAIFGHLEFTLTIIPRLITEGIDAWVSVRRVEEYLGSSENLTCTDRSPSPSITFQDVSIRWPSDSQLPTKNQFVLSKIKLAFPPNEMSIISGPTGAGKSLLLAAIIGEVDKLSGLITMPQTSTTNQRFANKDNWVVESMTALVTQSPWIEPTTIRQNILFGLPLKRDRYQRTLSVCALSKDLESFPDGDQTDIGSKGVNLSGGQRCRIAFARAVYSRAGILVLDDILSSLDAQVGRQIVEEALANGLGEGRTRILVTTHHVDLCLSKSAYQVVLGGGTVEYAGSSTDVVSPGSVTKPRPLDMARPDGDLVTDRDAHDVSEVIEHTDSDRHIDTVLETVNKFTVDEKKERGGYRLGLYKEYLLSAGGLSLWILALACFVGGITLDITKASEIRLFLRQRMADRTADMVGECMDTRRRSETHLWTQRAVCAASFAAQA